MRCTNSSRTPSRMRARLALSSSGSGDGLTVNIESRLLMTRSLFQATVALTFCWVTP